MNVLMFRIDSLSFQHFRRVMPKTYNYLANELENNVMYTMFNSVGENTHPNLVPLYSGVVVESIETVNLPPEIYQLEHKDEGFYDKIPFIWYEYEEKGYLTAYQVSNF